MLLIHALMLMFTYNMPM